MVDKLKRGLFRPREFGLKPTRITANLVGMMLFIQVILGGGAVLLQWPVIYHIIWGGITFGVLAGAFVVSIIFGLLSAYGIQFVSQFAPVLVVVFMAMVLAIRPQGLFGAREG